MPNDMAALAINCDLHSGRLEGFPQPQFIVDLTASAPWPVRKAYRIPAIPGDTADVWLPLPSEYSSVVPSPLTNDGVAGPGHGRYYWTNPSNQPMPGAWWNTYDRIKAGNSGSNAPYNMGFIAPPTAPLSVNATGGTTTSPGIERVYVYTLIDTYGGESNPNYPSNVAFGYSDSTWTVTGFPVSAPGNTGGMNYAPVAHMRLYRTVTGATSGANYYFVADIPFGTSSYVDTQPDTIVTGNNLLSTASALPPLANIDGLIAYPGGMLMAFTGNTLHFCEPDMPNSWPAGYDVSFYYPIVALAIWQSTLVVVTKGYPSNGSGTTPSGFVFSELHVPEPCIARGSVITDLAGVYYASQNGLVMLNYFGMQNQTLSNMTKNIWLEEYQAAHIVACRHRAQYLAINGTGSGFIIDYAEARMGIVHISPVINCVSVWNDVYTGDAYMCADSKIYLWDSPNTPSLIYRWRSKEFYLPAPTSMGAVQVSSDNAIMVPPPIPTPGPGGVPVPPPMSIGNLPNTPSLPSGVNAMFLMYHGTAQTIPANAQSSGTPNHPYDPPSQPYFTKTLTQPRELFRLPGGFKSFNWFFEVIARTPIFSVEIASTMKELRKV